MTQTIQGTKTERISSKGPAKSNTPKSDKSARTRVPGQMMVIMDPDFEPPPGFRVVGMHTGPRTKFSHPYNYDPLIVFDSSKPATGCVYTDRLRGWYSSERMKEMKLKHFGKESDYYAVEHSASKVENFLRELMEKPSLEVVAIEEHCNQATGFPVWYIAYAEPPSA